MAMRTDLRETNFPARDRNLEAQLFALFFIHSTSKENKSFFDLPKISGRLRMSWRAFQLLISEWQKNIVSSAKSFFFCSLSLEEIKDFMHDEDIIGDGSSWDEG